MVVKNLEFFPKVKSPLITSLVRTAPDPRTTCFSRPLITIPELRRGHDTSHIPVNRMDEENELIPGSPRPNNGVWDDFEWFTGFRDSLLGCCKLWSLDFLADMCHALVGTLRFVCEASRGCLAPSGWSLTGMQLIDLGVAKIVCWHLFADDIRYYESQPGG